MKLNHHLQHGIGASLRKYRHNSVRIMPKKVKSPVAGRKRSHEKSREGRIEVDEEERDKVRSSHRREVVIEEKP